MEYSQEDCLDFDPEASGWCEGNVELRDALSVTGVPYVRCRKHWEARVRKQHELEQQYPDSPHAPDWFDPANAGEHWDEDY